MKYNPIDQDEHMDYADMVEAATHDRIAGILCVYLTTDGQVREVMNGPIGTMKLLGEPAFAASKSLLELADVKVNPDAESFPALN